MQKSVTQKLSQRFFVVSKAVEIAKIGTNTIWRYSRNKHFFYAQECDWKIRPAMTLWKGQPIIELETSPSRSKKLSYEVKYVVFTAKL